MDEAEGELPYTASMHVSMFMSIGSLLKQLSIVQRTICPQF